MYELLHDFLQQPEPFSRYTAKELWTRPHLAKQMLSFHLDQSNDLASRKLSSVAQFVAWIDSHLDLTNKRVCDLGCGPGLYTQAFAERGATVTGVDFSGHSLAYASRKATESGLSIDYIEADYLSDILPRSFDVVTLIYCDFCVLSPSQRAGLLARIAGMLSPGGRFVLDVAGLQGLSHKTEISLCERRLMGGFWADSDYVGLQRCFIYPEQELALDRYLILEPDQHWEIFNWFQYFTASSLEAELNQAGMELEQIAGSPDDEELEPGSEVIKVIARKKQNGQTAN